MASGALALHLWSCNVPREKTQPRLAPLLVLQMQNRFLQMQNGFHKDKSVTNSFCRTCWLTCAPSPSALLEPAGVRQLGVCTLFGTPYPAQKQRVAEQGFLELTAMMPT